MNSGPLVRQLDPYHSLIISFSSTPKRDGVTKSPNIIASHCHTIYRASYPPNNSNTAGPRPTSTPCPIIQITLQGNNPFQAWADNYTTQAMEGDASRHLPGGGDWNTVTRAVYHGTQSHHATTESYNGLGILDLRNAGRHFKGLVDQINPNQAAPVISGLQIVWTGFSPQRCFLWTVFRGDVIGDITKSTEARPFL